MYGAITMQPFKTARQIIAVPEGHALWLTMPWVAAGRWLCVWREARGHSVTLYTIVVLSPAQTISTDAN